jgi:hypothetical protein
LNEEQCWWVGVVTHVGAKLRFKILSQKQWVIYQFVFVVKDLEPIDTVVGCKIIENKEKYTIRIHQPKLIKNIEEQFGPLVADKHPAS